ncbi:MAG: MarR family transcriptional regulator [Peptococcaceae bacterium]|nr:MarR family transcriptional regulator [Peptococcaceae bacterium]
MPTPTESRRALVERILAIQHRAHKAFHRHMRRRTDGLPLTFPKLAVLGLISERPGLTVSELARRFMGAKSNISEMVERLCREGLLEKRTDEADQRLTRIHLTDGGRELLKEFWARHVAAAQEMLTGLSDEQLASVAQSLEVLAEALNESNSGGGED